MTANEVVNFMAAGNSSSWYYGVRWNGCEYSVCDGRQVARANRHSIEKLIREEKIVRAEKRSGWVLA